MDGNGNPDDYEGMQAGRSDGLLLSATFAIELTNGNDGRGNKWFSSAKVRKQIETQLLAAGHEREPFDHPVRLVITRILGTGQRKWDADSILRGNSKELIDALVAIGWFVDDGPRWITRVDGEQDDTRRQDGPAVKLEVWGSCNVKRTVEGNDH